MSIHAHWTNMAYMHPMYMIRLCHHNMYIISPILSIIFMYFYYHTRGQTMAIFHPKWHIFSVPQNITTNAASNNNNIIINIEITCNHAMQLCPIKNQLINERNALRGQPVDVDGVFVCASCQRQSIIITADCLSAEHHQIQITFWAQLITPT